MSHLLIYKRKTDTLVSFSLSIALSFDSRRDRPCFWRSLRRSGFVVLHFMAMSLLSGNRLVNIGKVFVLILLIALADWRVDAEVPLGFLYLLPVALAGAVFSRVPIVLL